MENDRDDKRILYQPIREPETRAPFQPSIELNSGSTHPSFTDTRLDQLEREQNHTVMRVYELEQQVRELRLNQASSFPHGGVDEVKALPGVEAQILGFHGEHEGNRIDYSSLLEELDRVYEECSSESWDGYDAKPISRHAYLEAGKLVKILPLQLPTPEIVPEPGGDIGFEWYKGKGFSLILSVDGSETITYAASFGTNETYGTEELTNSFPETIAHLLTRLYPTSNE